MVTFLFVVFLILKLKKGLSFDSFLALFSYLLIVQLVVQVCWIWVAKTLTNKLRNNIGIWHHATFPFPKQPIPVSGNKVVNKIANKFWNNNQNVKRRPKSGQLPENPKGCIGASPELFPLNHNYRINFMSINLQLAAKFLSHLALQGCKSESIFAIALNDEVYAAIAEVADSIEEDDWFTINYTHYL